jgi:SAM-dependent methyltransferase
MTQQTEHTEMAIAKRYMRALKVLLQLPDEMRQLHNEILAMRGELSSVPAEREALPRQSLNDDVRKEPPIEEAYLQWREFYALRMLHYAEILKELPSHGDDYTEWYRSGGYGYDPFQYRNWLLNETSLPDFRGTCLDIGSGDGFWSWLLSEWYHVTGIDPLAGGVELAQAIKRRLPLTLQRRVDFVVGDALEVQDTYDVVFCRAPSFFNYPIYRPFDPAMLDGDRARLRQLLIENDPATVDAKLAVYPKFAGYSAQHQYAGNWQKYLEKLLAITNKLFVFILSTRKEFIGVYTGDTYNHDPEEVSRLFKEFGTSRVAMDSTGIWIVAELYK